MQPGEVLTHTFSAFTREQLKLFADAAVDHNPIHLDETFAKEAGFPSVIVHGMLSMSLLGNFLSEKFPERQWRCKKFSCRFKKVTFPGDVPTARAEIKSWDQGALVLAVSVQNQKGETTVEGTAEFQAVP